MCGGAGNDIYNLDVAGDVVEEFASEGTDTVRAGFSYVLTANVENLVLTGSASVSGTGNALNNQLTGNNGANILDGGTGADSMSGGTGNDIYMVDNAGDSVTENASAGADEIRSSVSFTQSANVETLTLIETASINGTGDGAANTIVGNSGNNVLNGGAGTCHDHRTDPAAVRLLVLPGSHSVEDRAFARCTSSINNSATLRNSRDVRVQIVGPYKSTRRILASRVSGIPCYDRISVGTTCKSRRLNRNSLPASQPGLRSLRASTEAPN